MDLVLRRPEFCRSISRSIYITVVIDIDMSKSQVEAKVYLGTMWPEEPFKDPIILEILRVKERAIRSIEDEVWKLHHSLSLKLSRSTESWNLSVYTPQGELIHSVEVD